MKTIIAIGLVLLGCTTCSAQTGATGNSAFLEQDKPMVKQTNKDALAAEFAAIQMEHENDEITFSGFSQNKRRISLLVTNTDGDIVIQTGISSDKPSVKVEGLPKGLYFANIFYRGKSKKGFVLKIE